MDASYSGYFPIVTAAVYIRSTVLVYTVAFKLYTDLTQMYCLYGSFGENVLLDVTVSHGLIICVCSNISSGCGEDWFSCDMFA